MSSFIYLITESPNKHKKLNGERYFKIGYSKDPKKRLNQIQVGFPKKLTIARQRFVVQHKRFEQFLHLNFSDYKSNNLTGEWFFGDIEKAVKLFDELGIKYGFDDYSKLNERFTTFYKEKFSLSKSNIHQNQSKKRKKKNLYGKSFKHSKNYWNHKKFKNRSH